MARFRDAFGGGDDVQIPINGVSVAPAGSATADLDVSGYTSLLVGATLAGTVTPADLSFSMKPLDDDGTTLFNLEPSTLSSVAAAAVGPDVLALKRYDVRGLKKVRITVGNANVAAKTATVRTYAGT